MSHKPKRLVRSSPPMRSATNQVNTIAAMSARSPVHVPTLDQLSKLRQHMDGRLSKDIAKAAAKGDKRKLAILAAQLTEARTRFQMLADRLAIETLPEPELITGERETPSPNPGWAYQPPAKRKGTLPRPVQHLGRAKTRRHYG